MIKTKYLVADITDVPSMWVFERYLKLGIKLTGQAVMIKSVFNVKDRDPSFHLSVSRKGEKPQYLWYDHSMGFGGDKIALVQRSFNLGFGDACEKIIGDYNQYVLENGDDNVGEYKEHNKYQVVDWKRRKWNILDRDYWQGYEVGSRNLERLQAWPLDNYRLDNGETELIITGEHIYGYFSMSGELYKIYHPMVKERKFLKIKSHIQGLDQLQEKSATCIITKSLKDIAVLYNLGEWQCIAPDSENTLLPERVVEDLRKRFLHIFTLFDIDQQGLAGMKKYEEKWGIPGIISPMEKDPSDSVKKYGGEEVARVFKELITNKLMEVV